MEWNALITYWYNTKNPSIQKLDTSLNSFDDDDFKLAFKLPFAGNRSYSNASLEYQGSYGFYWSSSPTSSFAYGLFLYSPGVFKINDGDRAATKSIRCFKDSPDAPETNIVTFNENGGDLL